MNFQTHVKDGVTPPVQRFVSGVAGGWVGIRAGAWMECPPRFRPVFPDLCALMGRFLGAFLTVSGGFAGLCEFAALRAGLKNLL